MAVQQSLHSRSGTLCMCGIAGVAGVSHDPTSCVRRMTEALVHRGPDSDGFFAAGGVGLGMRRLKVIDLDTGDQPVFSEDRSVATVFNGEIFNFEEIRATLLRKGHVFRSHTDTEVIVHQWEEDGEECFSRFRGMFAVALWDSRTSRLCLARDRFGIKPLFVAESAGLLAFASEIRALLELDWVDRSWDPDALDAYLALGYIPAPLTIYRGIRKFEPGTIETFEVTAGQPVRLLSRRRYWEPAATVCTPVPSYGEALERLRDLLAESVRLRLRSDVPLGAFLSGGIDSSTVVAFMRVSGALDIKTFSVGFEDARFNELIWASAVARHLGTEHYPQVITAEDALTLADVVLRYDEPFADSSAIPTFFVSRLAKQSVTVSLSGDGGDELFAGYQQYQRLGRYRAFDRLPRPLRGAVSRIARSVFSPGMAGAGLFARLGADADERHLSLVSRRDDVLIASSLSPRLREFLAEARPKRTWEPRFRCRSVVPEAQIVDQKNYLPDDILVKVDRSSMAVSLEARVPLLDHHFAEYANGLPESYKVDSRGGKRILKDLAAPLLPPAILSRPKMGFGVPLRNWLLGPLRVWSETLLFDTAGDLFRADGLREALRVLQRGHRDVSGQVWVLVCLAAWAAADRKTLP